ncbi:MAG: M48 family metalloprotease [Acidobacteria bacterium]|nr:M48 family metalloprotease [Acidobacteriota bacterium]
MKYGFVRLAIWVVCLVGAAGAAQEWWPPAPLPGYNIFNEQQEVWLGEVFAEELNLEREVGDDAEATAYLQALGERLAAKSKRPGLRYQFFLIRAEGLSAFALPGGRIYVSRGLVRFCQNEAELASIVAHEIGHVALRQGAKTFSRWLFWGLGVTKVGDKEDIRAKDVALHAQLNRTKDFQAAADLFFGIARGDELWADKYGIWNLYHAGYEPRAAVEAFRRFDALEREGRHPNEDPWKRLLELLFASHPRSGDRANLLKLEVPWMKAKPEAVVDSEAFRALKARIETTDEHG